MKIIALIPARMGSTRFPGKPLALILGKPMVGHVFERVSSLQSLSMTAVATCDAEIYDYIRSIGGTAIMTSTSHTRASDRCAEALETLERTHNVVYDIVVMVQGDEPMIQPEMIDEALQPLIVDPAVNVVNLLGQINSQEEFEDRNCIKVVCDLNSDALYFSREPIPTRHNSREIPIGKQVCVIPFRRNFLLEYTRMAPTPLEVAESIDMLRILEHGMRVKMVPTLHKTYSVDTPQDLRSLEEYLLTYKPR